MDGAGQGQWGGDAELVLWEGCREERCSVVRGREVGMSITSIFTFPPRVPCPLMMGLPRIANLLIPKRNPTPTSLANGVLSTLLSKS